MKIEDKTKEAIEKALEANCRVEIIPTREGIKVYTAKRKEIAKQNNTT